MFLRSRTPLIAFATLCIASQVACSSPAATSASDDLIAAEDTAIADLLAVDGSTDTAVPSDVAVADADGGTTDALLPDAADDAALDAASDAAVDAAPDAPGDATTVDAATDTVSTPDSGAPGSDAVDASPDVDVAAGTDAVAVCDPAACPKNACQSALCNSDGSCGLAPVKTCTDSNPCTDDSCDLATGCVFAPNQATCTDGDACTLVDACLGGACVGSDPVICVASDGCHNAGVCDPGSGTCSSPAKADKSVCDDGNFCTDGDTCNAGVCVGGTPWVCPVSDLCHTALGCDPIAGCLGEAPVVCTASDVCHDVGECDVATGACSNPVKDGGACEDGNLCTAGDTCLGGVCVTGYEPGCVAIDACHLPGVCLPATGVCTSLIGPDGVACDDGEKCTTDGACHAGVCAGLGQCEDYQTWAITSYDSYGNYFDKVDAYGQPGLLGPPDTFNVCGWDKVSTFNGNMNVEMEFDYIGPNAPNSVTIRETCTGAGAVTQVELRDTNYKYHTVWAGKDTSAVDVISNFRVFFPEPNYGVSAVRVTTYGYVDIDAVSLGFAKLPCTDYKYEPWCGCTAVAQPTGTKCNDGNACTANDTCTNQTCSGGPVYTCDDKNDCTADACDGAGGCATTPTQGQCQAYGVPLTVDVTASTISAQVGNPNQFATPQTLNCPAGSVATGFSGSAYQFLLQVSLDCAVLNPDGKLGAVSSTQTLGSGKYGYPGGTHCPPGTVLVAFDGYGGNGLNSVGGRCLAPGDLPYLTPTNTQWAESTEVDPGTTEYPPAYGQFAGFVVGSGGPKLAVDCPWGSVVTGIYGYAGVLPTQIGLVCTPVSAACTNHDEPPCNDGNPCTTKDTCSSGTCQPGGPTNCDDGYPFTLDSCDKTGGCVHLPGPSLKLTNVCATAPEGSPLTVSCPAGGYIANIAFASYGSVTGNCPAFTAGSCDAAGEVPYLSGQCLGKNTCTTTGWQSLNKNWSATVDPCGGAAKTMNAVFECWSQDNCVDGVKDGDESAVDCGGSVCVGCNPGQACASTADCKGYCGVKDKVCH